MTLAQQLQVLYGSQTGNAESIAKHLHEEAIARGFTSQVTVLDEFEKIDWKASSVLVIVVSTTGDGDFPDNTTKFFRWTRRGKKEDLEEAFAGKKFGVLALGDTNYTNFCQTGKRIERRLLELGASTFVAKGLADDATGLEAVIDPWVANLWNLLPSLVECDSLKARAFAESAARPVSSILKKQKTDVAEPNESNLTTSAPMDIVPGSVSAAATASTCEPMDVDSIPAHYTPFKHSIILPPTTPQRSEDVIGAVMLPAQYLSVKEVEGSKRNPSISAKNSLFHLFDQPIPTAHPAGIESVPSDTPTKDSLSNLFDKPTYSASSPNPFVFTAQSPFAAKIVGHRYLTGEKALKRVLEITMDIQEMGWANVPAGGVIGIVAPNPDEVVVPLLKRLGLGSGDQVVDVGLSGETGLGALPFVTDSPYTIYEAFRYFLDLTPPLRKPFLRVMAEYATNESERATLLHLTSSAGASLFKTLKQADPTISDLFATFPSVVSIPFSRLLETLTRLQPRFYSLSRIDRAAHQISVAFNITEYTHPITSRPTVGLCTPFLESLVRAGNYGAVLPIFPKPNVVFAPPQDSTKPMVLVAAGTGVTPFVSFLQARAESKALGVAVGETVLIHGRRFAEGDRIYGDEIDAYVKEGIVSRFVEVKSREDGNGGIKYVQDALVEQGAEVWRIVGQEGGYLFVCGGVEMARDVHAAVGKIVVEFGGVEGGEAGVKGWVKAMTTEGRYLKEIWS